MRVFAKDVTGQKLVHGFESRPLRLLCLFTSPRRVVIAAARFR
jgi:hypothetical protein